VSKLLAYDPNERLCGI
jgi:glycogen synthase kinase 3 beta